MKVDNKMSVRLLALQNAVFYKGKANVGAIMGKVLGEMPELRKDVRKTKIMVEDVVKEINSMSLAEQETELKKASPDMLKRERKNDEMPELKGAVEGKVATRFAPAPTGPLTIFHLMRAAFLSYYYAKRYKGKFVLRIEDSDPAKVKAEFYDFILNDLEAVGIEPDKIVLESGHMDEYYQAAEKMIKANKAYVCFCDAEDFKKFKFNKKDCPCRKKTPDNNVQDWKDMLAGKYKHGDAVIRLRTDMKEPNPVIRDPPLFRIAEEKHPKTGTKYRVWPLYNFACAYEDNDSGITHVFRAKEHEHNTAVQRLVYDFFGWKQPIFINFGLVYFPGTKMHKRDIKTAMEKGEYTGWDDPRLPTVKAFLRRGFLPKTFEEMSKKCGLSKNDIRIGWENLEGINRKFVDREANRYMVVLDPVKITIHGSKVDHVETELHPDFPERGRKSMEIDKNDVHVNMTDLKEHRGKKIRLIGLGNFRLDKKTVYVDDELRHDLQKIQFVSKGAVPIELLMPDGTTKKGLGEPAVKKLKVGDIIQMNRIGFARVDGIGKAIRLVFAHK